MKELSSARMAELTGGKDGWCVLGWTVLGCIAGGVFGCGFMMTYAILTPVCP